MEGPYLAELKQPRSRLAFRNKRLEAEYRAYLVHRERRSLRIQIFIGISLICAMVVMDYVFLAEAYAAQALRLRLLFMFPPMLVMLAMTWSPDFNRWVQPLGVVVGLTVGLTSLAIGVLAIQMGQPRAFAGYLVIIVFVYLFLGLRVPVAVATAMTLVLAYVTAAVSKGAPEITIVYNATYLLFLNVIGAYGAWQMDRSRRTEFLEECVLQFRANHDALTGLPNRRAFDEVLAKAWDNAVGLRHPLVVMLLDIDHFKNYNDFYGHQAGDHTIREVAQVLKNSVQRPQDFTGRYGGEEFVVMLFDTTRAHARDLAESIRKQISDKHVEHERSDAADHVTVSIGMAYVRPHGSRRSAEGILQAADQALYAAKERGRNRVVEADTTSLEATTGIFRRMKMPEPPVASLY